MARKIVSMAAAGTRRSRPRHPGRDQDSAQRPGAGEGWPGADKGR